MRKLTTSLYLPVAFLGATSLVACSFRVGTDPKDPQQANQPAQTAAAPTQQPATPAAPQKPIHKTGRPRPTPNPSGTPTTPTTPTGAQVVSAQTIFGGPTVDATGLKGNIYWIPAGTTTLPDLGKLTPNGFLFTSTLNVAPQAFTTGFPGVDATRKENFAIHYEGPLVVGTESDYDFRLVADDGAQLRIDATQASTAEPIVDNNGVHAQANSATGPVHLVVGTHLIVIDYFQAAGSQVALQLFCTKAGGTEQICPTKLP